MFRKLFASAIACVSLLAAAAHAQNLFVLPGANSINTAVEVFGNSGLPILTFGAGAGAFRVLAKPDGTKYYIVANSGSQTVTVVNSSFSTTSSLSFGIQATGAAVTPDGKYVLVAAGTLHVVSTSTDSDTPATGIPAGSTVIDVASSLDGTRALVLATTSSNQGVLYSIDLTNPSFPVISGNLPIANLVFDVTVGPNGLAYVSGQNRLYEINPATMALTSAGEIPLILKAGRPAFTPDGHYALVPNQNGGQVPIVAIVDLNAHTVTNAAPGGPVLDSVLVASNSLAFGYSSQSQSLITISIPSLSIASTNFPGIQSISTSAAALSADIAGGSHPSTRYLYVVSQNNLEQIDIQGNAIVGTPQPVNQSLPNAGVIALAGPANTQQAQTPATLLQYGGNQPLAAGAVSLPLVVRVLDSNGNPISGVPVNFTSTLAGLTIQNAAPTTGSSGFASTTITAPSTSGQFVVTATAGGIVQNFTFTIGTPGGGAPTGGLQIVAGQGQYLLSNFGTAGGFGTPLLVKVTDANGNPLANVQVTFDPVVSPGAGASNAYLTVGANGTDDGPTSDNLGGRIVSTDSTGLASVNVGGQTSLLFGYSQSTIQATAAGTNSVSFYVTVVPSSPEPTARTVPDPPTTFTGPAGTTIASAVQAIVSPGTVAFIPNIGIRLVNPNVPGSGVATTDSPYVACADPMKVGGPLTDATTGFATCNMKLIGPPGTYQFSVLVGYQKIIGPFTAIITPGAPPTPGSILLLTGNNATGNSGQSINFSVRVLDSSSNPIPNQTVTFQPVNGSSISLSATTAVTDANGNAAVTGTLGTQSGTFQLNVLAGSARATFNFTVNVPTPQFTAITVSSGSGQSAQVNTQFASQLVVLVTNGTTPVSGIPISFTASNGATVNPATATSDSNGLARTTVTAGASPGAVTVTAFASGISATFTLTVNPIGPSNVTFLSGASFQPGISPGSIAVIRGNGLLPGVVGQYNSTNFVGVLPTSLQGFGVTFNGTAAPIYYISNEGGQQQVAIQVPFEVAPGSATVAITTPGNGSATIQTTIQAVAPGFFETSVNGQNFGVATRPDGSFVAASNPALRGEVVCFYVTGLGQTSPGLATNNAGVAGQNVVDPMDIGLNNAGVRLVSATTLPGVVGVYQVCMQVPQDPSNVGPRQPVGLIVHDPSGDVFAPGTFIPVQ